MAEREVSIWFDVEGDYLEVLFDRGEGYFRATADDRVMEKIDAQGVVLGFSILGLSTMKANRPLRFALAGGAEL